MFVAAILVPFAYFCVGTNNYIHKAKSWCNNSWRARQMHRWVTVFVL